MWKVILVISLFISIFLFIKINSMESELAAKAGYNTVSLQLAFNQDNGRKIVESWKGDLKNMAKQNVELDFAFILLGYGLLIFSIGVNLKSYPLIILALITVLSDVLENGFQLLLFSGGDYKLVPWCSSFSLSKFSFLIIYMVILVYVGYTRLIRKRMQNA
jgi:hypothetical protein